MTRRLVGRRPANAIVLYHGFEYQAATWNKQRAVVAKIKWHRDELFPLAYNLGNFLRRLALTACVKDWTLTTLLVKLIKTGAKVVRHARYVTFQLAEMAVAPKIFAAMLARIRRFAAISLEPAPI